MTAVLIPMACWKVQVFPASWGCKQYDVQSEQNGFLLMAKISAICFVWLVLLLFDLYILWESYHWDSLSSNRKNKCLSVHLDIELNTDTNPKLSYIAVLQDYKE